MEQKTFINTILSFIAISDGRLTEEKMNEMAKHNLFNNFVSRIPIDAATKISFKKEYWSVDRINGEIDERCTYVNGLYRVSGYYWTRGKLLETMADLKPYDLTINVSCERICFETDKSGTIYMKKELVL